MSASSWGQSTRHGLLWAGVSLLGNKAVNFVSVMVLARLLTPDEFGVVAAVVIFLSFIELGSDLGMKATVVYEQEQGVTERVQSAFTVNLIIAAGLTVLGVLCAPLVAQFFNVADQADLFRVGALCLLFVGLGNIHDALLVREMDFKRRMAPQLAQAAVRAGISIGLAVAGFGAWSLVIGMLVGSAAWTAVQWILSPLRPTLDLDLGIVRGMASYGSAAAVLEVLSLVSYRADALIVGRVLGERALGLYTIAFRVPELAIETVAWNTSEVAFPALARKRSMDRGDLARSTMRLLRFQALYALPVAAGMAMVATPLIVVLFSSKWSSAGGVTAAIAVKAGITAVVFPLGDVFKALGRQRVLVVLGAIQLPIMIATIVLVAPQGIVAVAWARAGFTAVLGAIQIGFVLRALESDVRSLLSALRPALVTAAGVLAGAGAVALAFNGSNLAELLLGAAAGGAVGLLAARLFAFDAVRELLDQLRKMRPASAEPQPAGPEG
ncbi:MAG TPA: lipopolysaccharide biosynthesis protein [Solirubrobacterales bacterium]